ncbi:MAG: hypothetical protein AAB649_04995 [Patescibacteria group bacterium]
MEIQENQNIPIIQEQQEIANLPKGFQEPEISNSNKDSLGVLSKTQSLSLAQCLYHALISVCLALSASFFYTAQYFIIAVLLLYLPITLVINIVLAFVVHYLPSIYGKKRMLGVLILYLPFIFVLLWVLFQATVRTQSSADEQTLNTPHSYTYTRG